MTEYMVVCQSIVTDRTGNHITCWSSDMRRFDSLPQAKRHGFTIGRSDDFNIAKVRGKNLLAITWMGKVLKYDKEKLQVISKEIGL